jgi:hypothetical protein
LRQGGVYLHALRLPDASMKPNASPQSHGDDISYRDRKIAVKIGLLGHIRESGFGADNINPAGTQRHFTSDCLEQSAFPGPVGADHGGQ